MPLLGIIALIGGQRFAFAHPTLLMQKERPDPILSPSQNRKLAAVGWNGLLGGVNLF